MTLETLAAYGLLAGIVVWGLWNLGKWVVKQLGALFLTWIFRNY